MTTAPNPASPASPAVRRVDIEGLSIAHDGRVLTPRSWTAAQARWLAELAVDAPAGPILELCCGAGHIGLLAARLTGRDLVQVDRDPAAAGYAISNAVAAGVRSEVRLGDLADVLAPHELFPLALADPPWLRTEECGEFPEDPLGAVDGGPDGDLGIRAALDAMTAHLQPHGQGIVQIGRIRQVALVGDHLDAQDRGWAMLEVRDHSPGGLLVKIARP